MTAAAALKFFLFVEKFIIRTMSDAILHAIRLDDQVNKFNYFASFSIVKKTIVFFIRSLFTSIIYLNILN